MNVIIEEDIRKIINYQLPWEQFYHKSVLVTGATGMLGYYLVETLMFLNTNFNANIIVYAISRDGDRSRMKYQHHYDDPRLIHVIADLSDPIDFYEKINIVIHTASLASPKYYKTNPVYTIKPNVIGTSNLLDLCVQSKAEQFLMFSSSEIYGEVSSSNYLTEDNYGIVNPLELRACYAESKRMAEAMCIAWAQQYGLNVKIVRPFHTYGPGLRLDDGRVFADFVSNIVNNENIVLHSDGMTSRPFCYITDSTRAFFTILLKGKSGNAYNVANPEQNIKIIDLANLLIDMFPEKNLKVKLYSDVENGYIPSKITEQLPSIEKIKQLGWHPEVDAKQGFHRMVMSYE